MTKKPSAPPASPPEEPEAPYNRLIQAARLRETTGPIRLLDTHVLSDNARIVSSTGFRRLQAKAQVFSLEENAAVRSRLTHTLEVAMYGGLIANQTFATLLGKGRIDEKLRLPFVKTVENACLLHDVGNPPFGHLGEFAIREWFQAHRQHLHNNWEKFNIPKKDVLKHYFAFSEFDGNGQGLRIVLRLQWFKDEFGLNLTCTLLASMLKYLSVHKFEGRPFSKKAGFFETERNKILEVWKSLGLKCDNERPLQRHPLTFLMEAADDISYCLSDIDDAIEKKVISIDDFEESIPEIFRHFWPADAVAVPYGYPKDSPFVDFRIGLTRQLVDRAAAIYCQNEIAILNGTFDDALLKKDDFAATARTWLSGYAQEKIFLSRDVVNVELGGYEVIHGILNYFKLLLDLPPREFAKLLPNANPRPDYGELPLAQRLFALLPEKHVIVYRYSIDKEQHFEPIFRAHLVLDFLSGMTDRYALKVFKMLRGITVG